MLTSNQEEPKQEVVWQPQEGSQELFLRCPGAEVLYEGTRGSCKTDGLVMDFAQHTGQGYGLNWRGILFRLTFPQLEDIISRTKKWFSRIFPEPQAIYNAGNHKWVWATGEELLLRYMQNPDDYWNYHGHEYPWIGWEELTNWPTPDCYDRMKACNRSSHSGMPRKYRSNCNPYGVGHHWVKGRFVRNPKAFYEEVTDENSPQGRIRIRGTIHENKILMKADPAYIETLKSISDPNLKAAWLDGSWDIVAGGALSDKWKYNDHILTPFEIPRSWYINRSFDWGSSKPFSVGWWAESDGTEAKLADGTHRTFPPKTLFRIAEWYGWSGEPNKGCNMSAVAIAKKIKKIEEHFPFTVREGPAGTDLFDAAKGVCLSDDMAKAGVSWHKADTSPGSRKTGLERLRQFLEAASEVPMERSGIFIFSNCRHFIRTVPILPRDTKKLDDVDTDAEDHVYDETRYRLMDTTHGARMVDVGGI